MVDDFGFFFVREVAALGDGEELGVRGVVGPDFAEVPHLAAGGEVFSPEDEGGAGDEVVAIGLVLLDIDLASAVVAESTAEGSGLVEGFGVDADLVVGEELGVVAPGGEDEDEARPLRDR